jgi:hypothetical protein
VEAVDTTAMPWSVVSNHTRVGVIQRKFVREGEVLPGVGYDCDIYHYTQDGERFFTPRHHHDFEQIRYAISGDMDFGHHNTTQAGDIAYFPAGAYYGPQAIDEATVLLIQWSPFWVSRADNERAVNELKNLGTFENGFYITQDPAGKEVRKDSLNAIWEHVYQRPAFFPTPKYSGPIIMHPNAYGWRPKCSGVSIKMLGRFTEQDLQVYALRWEAEEATVSFGAERTTCLYVVDGQISADGHDYGAGVILWSDYGETIEVSAAGAAETVCVGFPATQ